MKSIIISIIGLILVVLIILGLSFGFGWTDVFYTKTVGKAKQNAEREVFEETRSYNQAKVQELAKYKSEYDSSDDKDAVASIIRHRFADYKSDNLPIGLKMFLKKIRGY